MSDFGRDANVERQQIHEISLNVARRLLKVLEAGRLAPPALAAEIEPAARVISGIQRDVENVMTAQPFGSAVDISILTHILSSQQHALGLLEQLEAKVQGLQHAGQMHAPQPGWPQHQPQPMAAPPHYPAQSYPATPAPGPYGGGTPPAPSGPARQPVPFYGQQAPRYPQEPPPGAAGYAQAAPQRTAPQQRQPQPARAAPARPQASSRMPDLAAIGRRMTEPRFAAATATLTVIASAILGALLLLPGPAPRTAKDNSAPGQKLDGRLDTAETRTTQAADPVQQFAPGSDTSTLEQPYLVVLSTRPSPEELQKDFQEFNIRYAELLTDRRARVDHIQGQDQKTWHRLSLIPPLSHADAKALCAKLKAAGLTGCWLRRVPIGSR